MGDWQVFISYSRSTSREYAEALQQALGSEVAFLDTSSVDLGEQFPSALVDALLNARVIVAFCDEVYFTRWYCLWELRTALSPFLGIPPDASEADKALALAPIVLALPPESAPAVSLGRLPPRLQSLQWPRADQIDRLAQWIRSSLAGNPAPLGALLERQGRLEETRQRLLLDSARLPPRNLAGVRLYPVELPPSIGSSFVGREDDLWRIDFALTTSLTGEEPTAVLSGALEAGGGYGKTRLALEYLHRLGPLHFPGGLFWVDADVSNERLEEQFHGILSTIRPNTPPLSDFRTQQRNAAHELAQALHSHSAKEPVLYIVDNVPEPAPGQSPKPLKTWCPALGKVALLVTSRARLSLGNEGLQALPVATLAPDAAVILLTEKVDRSSLEASDWRFIAEWVGHLPLALELLNRALRASAISPSELLAKARHVGPAQELDRQMEVLRPHIPEGQLRGVTEALSISYERLTPEAQRAAQILAQLSPVPIPVALLDAMDPLFPGRVRTLLTLRSFVTGATGGRVPSYGSMHRVLADFLRSCSPMTPLAVEAVGMTLVTLMNPTSCENPEVWPLLDACAPHAEWLFERLKASSHSELGLLLGQQLGNFQAFRGLVGRVVATRQSSVAQADSSLGPEHRATLSAKSALGDALRQKGDLLGARKVLEEALEIQQRVYGDMHSETLTVMNNLSLVLADLGDPKARPMAEHVLAARLRILGEEDLGTLHSMSNLATILWDLDDVEGSRRLHERALSIRRRLLGEYHPHTFLSKDALATTIRRMGDYQTARTMQEDLLRDHIHVMGKEHPATLNVMLNLTTTLFAQSDFPAAQAIMEELIVLSSRVLGEGHPLTCTAKTNLAHTLRKLGEFQRARTLYEQVLSARRQTLGEHHSDTFTSWVDLAGFLEDRGDLRESRIVLEQALSALAGALGKQAPPAVRMAWRLFCLLDQQDEIEPAQKLIDQYLSWLLGKSPDSLELDLQKIREQLIRTLKMSATPYHR